MKNTEARLIELLNESTTSFMNQDINSISEFITDDFKFTFFFERDDKKWVTKGGKKEYLDVYRKLFFSGIQYISWDYKIISSSKTLLGKIKATILFTCLSKNVNEPPTATTNIENIIYVVKNGKLKLKSIEANIGKHTS